MHTEMQKSSLKGFRLSPQQRRLWSLECHAADAAHPSPYYACCRVLLEGPADEAALREALREVVRRQEVLRTSFRSLPGMSLPLQVINPPDMPSIEEHDLSSLTAAEQARQIDAAWERACVDEGDFERETLLRLWLLRLSPAQRVLIARIPSLCADAASLRNVVADVSRCYGAALRGQALADEPVQYADVSEIQNELLEDDDTEVGREYWSRLDLTGLETFCLPYARWDGAAADFNPRTLVLPIEAVHVSALEALTRRSGTTPDVLLLTCWQVLLWRLTGQPRVTVGVSYDGRNYDGLGPAVGLFSRYLPLSLEPRGRDSFERLSSEVAASAGEHTEYQEYFNWEPRAEDGAEPTRLNYFPFLYEYDERPRPFSVAGLSFTLLREHACTERYHVRLRCTRSASTLSAEFHYDPSLYAASDISRLAEEFSTLITSVALDPQSPLSELEVVGECERRLLLHDWNDTAADFPRDTCVHHLFERHAHRTPDALALLCGDEELSYAELNAKADAIAHRLRRLGVGPESRVALLVGRSASAVAALLGALKAGAAYVPLDSSSPGERLRLMLEDCGAAVLIAERALLDSLPEHRAHLLCLDDLHEDQEGVGDDSQAHAPASLASPACLAYVIYTSGSTGTPKGVMVSHRSLLNYTLAASDRLRLLPPFSAASVSTLSADLGHTALFPALCTGSTLHLIPREVAADAALLADYFSRRRVDVLKIVPSHLSALMSGGGAGVLPRARLVLGGEALDAGLAARLRESAPSCEVYNHYGPTEATVGALAGLVEVEGAGGAGASDGSVALGRPLGNVRAYVLSPAMRLLPAGAAGELYLGGEGVARGYLNRPALTAERFVPDPFSGEAGARLYRTGDVARHLSDGRVQFRGRADQQVKVRGYRVEPGEVEAALRSHPGVEAAAVAAREGTGGVRLLGYAVAGWRHREEVAGRRRRKLPNGLAVVEQNREETDYQFGELFERGGYLDHGVSLRDGAVVFDVGANVGMFSLAVLARCRNVDLYAFEPVGETCEALRLNAELYGGGRVKVFAHGLSDEEREEEFTHYPRQSMMSGASAYSDAEYEKEVVRRSARNEVGAEGAGWLEGGAGEELLGARFEAVSERVRVRRLSDVLREEGVERIDLLKIDVQRAEFDVLRGMEEADWAKVGQVAMEVHDRPGHETQGRLREVTALLRGFGFRVVVEQEGALAGTDRYNLYAVRDGWWGEPDGGGEPDETRLHELVERAEVVTAAGLRDYLRGRLPDYMVPSRLILMDSLPLTANGKLDRAALPEPVEEEGEERAAVVTAAEEIVAGIWAETLKLDNVGAEDDFFELGGHSLLATQVMSRIRQTFNVELHLLSLFESPTVRGFARLIEAALKAEQGLTTPPIRQVERTPRMPLSFAQQRLWFLNQLEPDSAFYHCPAALRLRGALDIVALERTLREVFRRHEVLRTSFPEVGGRPTQSISPASDFALPLDDLSQLEPEEREREASRLARAEAERPFDLAAGPLVRARLIRLSEQEHVMLLTMHHIVSDGWSIGVLVKEVSALYEAFSRGAPSPLAELPVQYADYAVWQREWLRGETLERQLDYWRASLRGAPEALALPTDRPRPSVQGFRGASHSSMLPAEVFDGVKALARREGTTLFMALLAGWQTLLHCLSRQEEVVVGTPIAGRNQAETEPLIGFFVNTLVLRGDLRGDPSFREFLGRVRETCLGAYAHQDLPFEKLVERLRPERRLDRAPLFQVWFAVQNAPASELRLGEITLEEFKMENTTAKSDLVMSARDTGHGLKLVLEYNSDLFDADTISRMLKQYEAILGAAASRPDIRLGEFREAFDEQEKRRQSAAEEELETLERRALMSVRRRRVGEAVAES